jgi:hypothetical protein
MKSSEKEDAMDAMYGLLADTISRGLAGEVGTSALPDAPVRTQPTRPTPRRRILAARLRRRSASLLVGLAGRLESRYPDGELTRGERVA